jgi:broad specificity phosphatase PhoE
MAMDDHGAPIMLIRHAEKAQDGERAVNAQGEPDEHSLSVMGWQRAGALVHFFAMPDGHATHGRIARPLHLLAARATAQSPSTRPRDTLGPLAQALGLKVDESASAEDPLPELAARLRQLQGPVLVCWRHDSLPALANELLQRAEAPERWPPQCYDMVWVVAQESFSRTLVQVPQRLLPGDSTHALRRRRAA